MEHLAGWTVAVTADRRAAEQAELLQRRGADVVMTPLVQARPLDEAEIRTATDDLLRGPLDLVVATSAVGLRSWLSMAWTWDLGDEVQAALRQATVIARGAKAAGVLVGEDVEVDWTASAETLAEVLELQAPGSLTGRRVGVLLPGSDVSWFLDALRARGAVVVPVPVFEVVEAGGSAPRERLTELTDRGALDAITFTAPAAVHAVAAVPGLVEQLRRRGVASACVGPITAAAAERCGLPDIVTAGPHRLGSMVRTLGEHLLGRARTFEAGGVPVRHQGTRIEIGGVETRLTPRERRLLDAMLATTGAVLSKERWTSESTSTRSRWR